MKVKDFMMECIADGDLDKEIMICVDKLILKPVEEERYAYISIGQVVSYGSCLYCTPSYCGMLYENLPPVNIENMD